MAVYLLHFTEPYKHAKHYIGWADNVDRRMEHHRRGTGGNLPRVVIQHGGDWVIARVWPDGDKNFERRLKNRGGASRICPICREKFKRDPRQMDMLESLRGWERIR